MDHLGMILSGYVLVFGTVLAYGAFVIGKGRRLGRELGLTSTNSQRELSEEEH